MHMREQEQDPDEQEPKKNKFMNQNANVSSLVVLVSSLFVIFLVLVGLDLIGVIQMSHILHYFPHIAFHPRSLAQINSITNSQDNTYDAVEINDYQVNDLQLLQDEQQSSGLFNENHKIFTIEEENQESDISRSTNHKHNLVANSNQDTKNNIQTPVDKPLVDQKEYSYFEMPNKLKVLLIYDEHSTMAEASMSVQLGTSEHIFFRESDTYPGANYFDDFVTESGGSSDAHTHDTYTNYHFEVDSRRLPESLQIFSHLFIDPILDEQAASKYQQEETLIQSLISTLQQEQPCDTLSTRQTYLQDHYSSNLMQLAIRSNLNNADLEVWIREISDIKLIVNNDLNKPNQSMPIQQLPLLVKMNSQEKALTLIYQVPSSGLWRQTKPLQFVSNFINQGGLRDYLVNQQGFLLDMEASVLSEGDAYHIFMINMQFPTNNQAFDQKQLAFRIAKVCHNYLEKMKETLFDSNSEPTPYMNDMYEQQSRLSLLNFQYVQQDQPLSSISECMSEYPMEDILRGKVVMEHLDAQLIRNYLDHLSDTNNLLIVVADDEYVYNAQEPTASDVTELTQVQKGSDSDDLKFIHQNSLSQQTELLSYDSKSIQLQTAQFISKRESIIVDSLQMPPLNEVVPESPQIQCVKRRGTVLPINDDASTSGLILVHQSSDSTTDDLSTQKLFGSDEQCAEIMNQEYPYLLRRDLGGDIWWTRSQKMPSAFIAFKFEPIIPQTQTSLKLFNQYVLDKLREEHTNDVALSSDSKGITVKISGFSSKIKEFLKHIFDCMNPNKKKGFLQIREESEQKRFERAKTKLSNLLKQEDGIAEQLSMLMMSQPIPSPDTQLKQLDQMQFDDLASTRDSLFNNFRYSGLFVGNLLKADVYDILEDIRGILSKSTTEILVNSSQQIIDLHGHNIIYALQSDKMIDGGVLLSQKSKVTLNFYQIHHQKSYPIMHLLSNIFQNKAHQYLSQERRQTVKVSFTQIGCTDGVQIVVQGMSQAPYQVNHLIEQFLENFGSQLEDMSRKKLFHLKRGVVAKLNDNMSSLEGSILWDQLNHGYEERQILVSKIKHLKKNDILDFYLSVFKQSQRGKLSIQMYGKEMQKFMLNVSNQDEFASTLSSRGLSAEQSYANREEKVVFNSEQFDSLVDRAYECDYQISNI